MNNITEIFGPKQVNTLVQLTPFQAGDFQVTGVISTCQHGKIKKLLIIPTYVKISEF